MSKRKQQRDPKLESLLETEMKLSLAFDRWYSRLKRSLSKLDTIRRQRKRVCKQIAEYGKPPAERTQP